VRPPRFVLGSALSARFVALDDAGRHEPVEEECDPSLAPPGKWRRRNLFDLDFTNQSRR
jgi:hypothetical protein